MTGASPSRAKHAAAPWNVATLIYELEPRRTDEDTQVCAIDVPRAHDDTAITHPSVHGLLARTHRALEPRIADGLRHAAFVSRRLLQKPLVWAAVAVALVLGAHAASAGPRATKTPVQVRVLAPLVTVDGAITDAAVQDLECMAIQALVEQRPEDAIRIYEALAAHAPSHDAYARAAEIVAASTP